MVAIFNGCTGLTHFLWLVHIQGSELHQRGCNGESSSRDINDRETVHGLSGRYHRNNRLPGSVLLAKERLVQRLRGVSVSGIRLVLGIGVKPFYCYCLECLLLPLECLTSFSPLVCTDSRETSPGLSSDHLQLVDADWETSVSGEEPAAYTTSTELLVGANQQYASREPQRKPLGLTKEALSQLQREVFLEQQKPVTQPMPIDCSICLESFVEGNKLINLPCGHRFHTSCLYPWLQTCGKCPYCRSYIKLT